MRADVDDAIAYVREMHDAGEEVSLDILASLCRALEWRLTIRPMPGGDTLATVVALGKPFTSRGPFLAGAVLAALVRALDYHKPRFGKE